MTKEQRLINKAASQLPISVFPEKGILAQLRKNFEDIEISLSTEFEIHSMHDMGKTGGITCELVPKGMKEEEMKAAFLCSITHLRVKRGEPLYKELEKYRIKRIRNLNRQNRLY